MRYDYTSLAKFAEENHIAFSDDYSRQNVNIFTIISGMTYFQNYED